MSAIEKFIDKVEKALTNFIEDDAGPKDAAVIRLKNEEELILEELKSYKVARSGRSLLTCGLTSALIGFSLFGYAFAWPLAVNVVLAVTAVVMGANLYSLSMVNKSLDALEERHETLLIAMDERLKRRANLTSNSKGESLILELDSIDEKIPGTTENGKTARSFVREKVRDIKRSYIFPMLNYRERKAKYLIDQDPGGLEKEINEAMAKQLELETGFDIESSMILERTINAKRETLERLADAEREFQTIDLSLDSVFSQIEHAKALIVSGGPDVDLEELKLVFSQIEHGLEVSPGVPPKALPEGTSS